jgi:hypothetical protein
VSPAEDFASFRLHRGTSADFLPRPTNLIASLADTGYVDEGPAGGYYKLSATDRNGTEGPFALVGPQQTTDVPASGPGIFALEGARPNPARSDRLRVGFSLPGAAPATLELFDAAGRRIARRAVGALGAGRHVVELAEGRRLPPGVFVVRLAQGGSVSAARVAVLE